MTTAALAKEALEGHCIYDGGYCKLHLSYSRHTDLNVKVQIKKSVFFSRECLVKFRTQPSLYPPTNVKKTFLTRATWLFL